jgi:hypothetical protein
MKQSRIPHKHHRYWPQAHRHLPNTAGNNSSSSLAAIQASPPSRLLLLQLRPLPVRRGVPPAAAAPQ